MTKIVQISFLGLALLLQRFHVFAEDKRGQYPSFISNSYLSLNLGYINYPFSNLQMEPGFRAESVHIPHLGIRIVLGHQFNNYFSAQISYMKPLSQVEYRNINGGQFNHTVWMHAGTFTAKSQVPIQKNFSVYGEGGLGIFTRRGFEIDDLPVVKSTSYATFVAGGGMQYQLNNNWDLTASVTYSPANENVKQPHTVFFSGGFQYNIRPLSAESVKENSTTPFIFPRNLLQVGYTTNAFGYGANNFLSKRPVDIFWGGKVEVQQGFSVRFERNLFHTRKIFSFDLGTSFGYWKSKENNNEFYTISAFPLFRFTVLRSRPVDLYLNYSVAGPSFISRINIDDNNTGKHFTFQDFMGIGVFIGKNRNINAEIGINHYSNGNIFLDNAAVKIPLTFHLGYTF